MEQSQDGDPTVTIPPEALRPYQSFLIAEHLSPKADAEPLPTLVDAVVSFILTSGRGERVLVSQTTGDGPDDLRWTYIVYRNSSTPGWLTTPQLTDVYYGIVIILHWNSLVALHTTPDHRESIRAQFGKGLSMLRRLPRDRLHQAFVNGPARRIWMSGIHRSTALKPDAKYMSGSDLRQAIDPTGDRTFYFTAARSVANLNGTPIAVGVTPRKSSVWVNFSIGWNDFLTVTRLVLATVASATQGDATPLPYLATPDEPDKLKQPYDMCLIPTALLTGDVIDADDQRCKEHLAYDFRFDVQPGEGPDIDATVAVTDVNIATVHLSPLFHESDVTGFDLEIDATGDGSDEDVSLLRDAVADDPGCVNVWYASGHTLSGGSFYSTRHSSYPFIDFAWVDFAGYVITKEKPNKGQCIGADHSLFCWVRNNWPLTTMGIGGTGWLACDDGAHEVADFVHWDENASPVPVLTLIHVKAADSDSPNRKIAVTDFQIVVAQSLKNLRFLDSIWLSEGLAGGLNHQVPTAGVWHNGTESTVDAFRKAVLDIGNNYRRRLVIVQPHLQRSAWTKAANAASESRLRLNDLLLETKSQAMDVAAELLVVAADS
jgi:hypothetical protein